MFQAHVRLIHTLNLISPQESNYGATTNLQFADIFVTSICQHKQAKRVIVPAYGFFKLVLLLARREYEEMLLFDKHWE